MWVYTNKDGTVTAVGSIHHEELARLQAAAKKKASKAESKDEAKDEVKDEPEAKVVEPELPLDDPKPPAKSVPPKPAAKHT